MTPMTPMTTEDEILRKIAEQEKAFADVMNYSPDTAYGVEGL